MQTVQCGVSEVSYMFVQMMGLGSCKQCYVVSQLYGASIHLVFEIPCISAQAAACLFVWPSIAILGLAETVYICMALLHEAAY